MKRIFILIVAMLAIVCNAQTMKVGVEQIVELDNRDMAEAIVVGVEASMNDYINIGIDAELYDMGYTTTNVVGYLSANLINVGGALFKAKAGIGWGHAYTNAATDHNYHTYKLSLPICFDLSSRISIEAEPAMNCRTYDEHIGWSKDRAWYSFSASLVFKFGIKNK